MWSSEKLEVSLSLKEIVQNENNLKTVRFELRNEEDDLYESTELEEEVEKLTLVVRSSVKRVRKPKSKGIVCPTSIPHLC
jgi:hypothetical protein